MGPMKKKWMGRPPGECQLCHLPLGDKFVDGRLSFPSGPWAIMCVDCFKERGAGLGTGVGQKYEREGDEFVKTAG